MIDAICAEWVVCAISRRKLDSRGGDVGRGGRKEMLCFSGEIAGGEFSWQEKRWASSLSLSLSPPMVGSTSAPFYSSISHDDGPQSSEDGSGMHSPVLYGPAHGDSCELPSTARRAFYS